MKSDPKSIVTKPGYYWFKEVSLNPKDAGCICDEWTVIRVIHVLRDGFTEFSAGRKVERNWSEANLHLDPKACHPGFVVIGPIPEPDIKDLTKDPDYGS